MKVLVYVEGPSDKAAMEALLRHLLEQKRQEGVDIKFFDSPKGDKKASVLTKVPRKAVNILLNDPHSIVVAMPDLYPLSSSWQECREHRLHRIIYRSKFPPTMAEKYERA